MDKITFDFETGEIIFECKDHKGVEFNSNLKEVRDVIMAIAKYNGVTKPERMGKISSFF